MNKKSIVPQRIPRAAHATCLLAPLVIGALPLGSSSAATLPVANCNDAGSGSLRDAISAAHSGDTVDLSGLTCSKISLTTGALVVGVADLTLKGAGADKLTIEGGALPSHLYSVINHLGTGTLRVESLQLSDPLAYSWYSACIYSNGSAHVEMSTVANCSGEGVYGRRGAVISYSTIRKNGIGIDVAAGNIVIRNSTIAFNAGFCGGIILGRPDGSGDVEISGSTISGNYAKGSSGGAGCIMLPAKIVNSTIADNVANLGAPGLVVKAPLTIESSILANSYSYDSINDLTVYGVAVSGHNNLIVNTNAQVPPDTIRASPQLLPLADNGGPTLTHALATTSPAIDRGNNSAGHVTDQRGTPFVRVAGTGTDIGAFELQATPAMSIGPGFTGSWYDPNQSGQGLTIEVLSGNRFYATWFAFDPLGHQTWFTGVGLYSGNTATLTQMVQPQGARWLPNFHSADIVVIPWGALTFTFNDCDHGRVDYDSTVTGFGSGHMDLTRLTMPAGLTCP